MPLVHDTHLTVVQVCSQYTSTVGVHDVVNTLACARCSDYGQVGIIIFADNWMILQSYRSSTG